jgi:serine/threonine-protein kinase
MKEPPETVGRYHIEKLIAHGGMGSLYLARDPAIDRRVVIKFLKEGFDDAAARERFALEARAAGRLHHPNIVTVFDVGEHDHHPFIAMEYVSGETLAELIKRRALGRVWEKLAILEDLCAGLHYAHCGGIIHRDIKPANVMRDDFGLVKILDFGIARGGGSGITRDGDIVGTLNYMAPEQLAGDPVDRRADIYSVGAVAYELITDHMAFPGTVQTGVLFKILNAGAVPIESLAPGTDPEITAMIERAMAREPHARYQDLDAMRQDLAVVRTRLLDAASDLEETTDPNAETRLLDSGRITSGKQARPSSRAGSTLHQSARTVSVPPPSGQMAAPPRRSGRLVFLGVAIAALAVALLGTLTVNWLRVDSPPAGNATRMPAQPQSEPAAPSASPPPPVSPKQPAAVDRSPHEEQLSAARETARRQIVAGDTQRALDTLVRGLALEEKDPELNGLFDELTGAARRTATESRSAAVVRGANPKSSTAFRDGQAREREANTLLRAGDRVGGIRAAWAAAALYNKAPEGRPQNASAPSSPGRPTEPATPSPMQPGSQPVVNPPAPDSIKAVPAPLDKPAGAPLPPLTLPKPEAPPPPRAPAPDPRAADQSAIRDTLHRYAQAYQSLDGKSVGRMMPSLSPQQLRDLDRDFSNYRSYTVEIRDERIELDGQTAKVTCQVVRSFETKNGVAGRNTVASVFHLRRSGAGWTIERLESR